MNRLVLALALALLLAIPAAAQGILPPSNTGPGNSELGTCDADCEAQKEKDKELNAAEDRHEALSKTVRGLRFSQTALCEGGIVSVRPAVSWYSPALGNDLSHYRVNWTVYDSWPSYKQPNNRKRGNVFIKENVNFGGSFIVPVDNWPKGKTLKVRVRAAYDDAKNGPWAKLSLAWPCS